MVLSGEACPGVNDALDQFDVESSSHAHDAPSMTEALRYGLGAAMLRPRTLRREIRSLGQWLEAVGFPAARAADLDCITVTLRPPTRLTLVGGPRFHAPRLPDEFDSVAGLLQELAIERIHMDPRLESNQVTDLLKLLWMGRKRLLGGAQADGGLAGRLTSDEGIQFACTRSRLAGGELTIEYSYCVTRFSRMVRWFERQHHRLSDHRALFAAAPKFGLLAGVILFTPYIIYLLVENRWVLLAVTLAGAGAIFAMVYTFFMVVGSVEYDNEVKAMRLEGAYRELQRYAARVRDDLQRARTVQQKLLPDPAAMPLCDKLQWACSFQPEAAVGGDYYDAAERDDGCVAILFGDVSGHGMAAAFVTAILKTAFQRWIDEPTDLPTFVGRLNHNLHRLIPEDSFAAVFVALYDPANHRLEYVNGGHHPEPLIIPAEANRPPRPLSDARAMLLGVTDDVPVRVGSRTLRPGDTFLAVTDGVIEAFNVAHDRFGDERLAKLLQDCRGQSLAALVDCITAAVEQFVGEAEQSDDRTVLAFRVVR